MVQKVTSFGYRHRDIPQGKPGTVVLDVRRMFYNPYRNPALRKLNGTHPAVQAEIRKTPHFDVLYRELLKRASAPGIDQVFVGCMGGHHRSVYLAELLGKDLGVPVQHRDLTKA